MGCAFVTTWVARFGCPNKIVTGRGPQLESAVFHELLCFHGTHRLRMSAYHPQTNGLVERFHRQLKATLTAHGTPSQWVHRLPLVLLGIRCALKSDFVCSSAKLVYGISLRLPRNLPT